MVTQQLDDTRRSVALRVVLFALAFGVFAFVVATIFGDPTWGAIFGSIVFVVGLLPPWRRRWR